MGNVDSPTFGELLRRHRLAAKLTQEALAERAGLSVRGIQDLERYVTKPLRDTALRLAQALALFPEEHARFVAAALPLRRRTCAAPASDRAVLAAHPHNLPLQLTSFIGRDREVAGLTQALTDARAGPRLLTLIGAGGCGKTRLALRVAAAVLAAYPDGVWLVDLAPVSDSNVVPRTVASVFDVRETPGQPVLDALLHVLNGQRLLLVLDNCEHLLDACAHLVDTSYVRVLICES